MVISPQQSGSRSARRLRQTLIAVAVSALALAALPAAAQQGSGGGTYGTGNTGTSGTTGTNGTTGTTGSGSASGTTGSATGARLARDDMSVMTDLAQANIAEIETGRMALEKSQNAQVRRFAQQMIDDHTAALQQLRTLAQSKGVTLTDDTDLQHKTLATALRVLSGETFDSQYLKRVGVNDHERTIELLQKAQTRSADPDIKAMAAKMMPTVQGHLKMARQMSQQMGGKNGSDAGSRSDSSGSGRSDSNR